MSHPKLNNTKGQEFLNGRVVSFIILIISGIATGLFQIGFGILSQDGFSLSVGSCYLVLSIALVLLQNWIRVVFISCSLVFLVLEYVPIVIAGFTIDPFYKMGVLFYLPSALFALYSIIYLEMNNIKKQFKGYLESTSERIHNERIIWWRTYFYFLVFLLLASIYSSVSKPFQWPDLIITIIALIGLFGFAWQKSLKPFLFWKFFSLTYSIWNIYYEFFLQPILPYEAGRYGNFSLFMVHILALVKILPLMVALYVYAFRKRELEEKGEKIGS